MMSRLRQYFITGLLVWLPMGVTVWVLLWLVGILDGIFLGVLAALEAMIPGLEPLGTQLRRIPGLGVILVAIVDTLFSGSGQAFSRALLVQYPRQGAWTIAFLTGRPGGEVARHLDGDYLSVYVPTTPNPTSGFFLMVPRADVIELEMSVDEALKYIISMGVVVPPLREPRPGDPVPAPQVPGVTGPLHPPAATPPAAPDATTTLPEAAAARPEP